LAVAGFDAELVGEGFLAIGSADITCRWRTCSPTRRRELSGATRRVSDGWRLGHDDVHESAGQFAFRVNRVNSADGDQSAGVELPSKPRRRSCRELLSMARMSAGRRAVETQ